MKKSKFTKYCAKVLILLACIGILIVVPSLRDIKLRPIGKEAYFYLRFSESPSLYDSLSYGGRFSSYYFGTPFLLSLFGSVRAWLPLVVGFLTFLVFYLILEEFNVKKNVKYLSSFVFLISPPFIYLSNTLNRFSVALFLSMLGFLLFIKKSKFLNILSTIIIFAIPSFNLVIALITIFVLLLYIFFYREKRILFTIIATLVVLHSLSLVLFFILNSGFPHKLIFIPIEEGIKFPLQRKISDFGSKYGLSLSSILIGFFGCVALWKKKYSNPFIFFLTIFLIILTTFRTEGIFLLNVLLSFFVANGIIFLIKRKWESSAIKMLTLVIFICLLIFSGVSHINRLIFMEPSEKVLEGMELLKYLDEGVVFSHYTRGFWISYANKTNVMDENFLYAPNVNERWKDSQELLYTRDITKALKIIEKYNIKYIWLDKKLKEMIYKDEEEGLLFLLKYGKNFKKIYDNGEVEIWKIEK